MTSLNDHLSRLLNECTLAVTTVVNRAPLPRNDPRLHTVQRIITTFHHATEKLRISRALFTQLNGPLGPHPLDEDPLPPAA